MMNVVKLEGREKRRNGRIKKKKNYGKRPSREAFTESKSSARGSEVDT